MAMTDQGMADAIYTEMENTYQGMNNGGADTKEYYRVISSGIINYLKSNMDILPGTFTNSGGNVTGKGKVE